MRIALLGLPGCGKTTVFNAMADRPVEVPPGLLQTETHVQVVRVHDPRLDRCREIFRPKKFTPAGLELWDPPGVALGAGEHEVERRTRLFASLREADAYVLVVRDFTTDRYPYDRPAPDPAADLERLTGELVTADFVVAEGRRGKLLENIRRGARTKDEDQKERAVIEKCLARLEAGLSLLDLELDEADDKRIRGFQFFSRKPHLVLVNGADPRPDALAIEAPVEIRARLGLDAALEAELAALEPEERSVFMEEFGIEEPASDRLVHEIYRAVGLRSFFTVGEDEVRAWTIRAGDSAVEAAGRIHTDLARGFIRAEVYRYEDLAEAGSEKEVKARGLLRLEGKNYVVQDGEIVHIRSGI
ncbi:MAG: DUF933 domain-containing protein [Planctomycetota bacterium]